MGSADIIAILQVVKFGIDTVDAYNRGELTDEEVAERWKLISNNFNNAVDLWNRAGQ